MYSKTIALTGAFAALAAAVPMAKRDIVWVTQTEEAVVTVPVTTTVWVDPTEVPQHYGHKHSPKKQTKTVQSTIIVRPSPSAASSQAAPSSYEAPSSSAAPVAPASSSEESSSVYVAPTPSSTYVAPTTSTPVYVAPTTSSSVYVAPTPSSTYVAPTTSSVYVAPTTSSTSVYVAPSTYEAPSSTSAAAPAYSSAAASSGSGVSSGMGASGTSYTGDLTYFAVGLGACGQTSTEQDKMVAISEKIFDSYLSEAGGNPNKNPLCGKSITITGADGSPYTAQIWDRCPGCDEGSLDLPEAFFNTVTYDPATKKSGDGRVKGMKWSFN